MSNIELLPLLKIAAGVQADEDFNPSIAFFAADGVTPLSLAWIAFTARIGSVATLASAGGQIVVSGAAGNILSFNVLAAAKNWPTGRYPFSLLATDGTYTRDVFADSFLVVGAPAFFSATPKAGYSSAAQASAALSITAAISTCQNSADAAAALVTPAGLAAALAALIPTLPTAPTAGTPTLWSNNGIPTYS